MPASHGGKERSQLVLLWPPDFGLLRHDADGRDGTELDADALFPRDLFTELSGNRVLDERTHVVDTSLEDRPDRMGRPSETEGFMMIALHLHDPYCGLFIIGYIQTKSPCCYQ